MGYTQQIAISTGKMMSSQCYPNLGVNMGKYSSGFKVIFPSLLSRPAEPLNVLHIGFKQGLTIRSV